MDVTIENLKKHLESERVELLDRYEEKASEFIAAHKEPNLRLVLMDDMSELNLEISKNLHAMWTVEGLENK